LRSPRRRLVAYVAVAAVFSALPVFAREVTDPLSFESVRVVRPGQKDLFAGLVAARDGSVALDHCGTLIVIPTPAELHVSRPPSRWVTGRTVAERLHVRHARSKPKRPRLC
jgi:hypothetical protein